MRGVPPSRRGITLLEVLIAMGILAIGLSSVVALVPAGRSQASRAVVLDRAASLAANVLADVATFGLLRDGALTEPVVPGRLVILDPVSPAGYLPDTPARQNVVAAQIRAAGIFSTTTEPPDPGQRRRFAERLFLQGRDDLVEGEPPGDDLPPPYLELFGTRAFQGRMTALIGIAAHPVHAWLPGRVSVVVFHNRDPSFLAIPATLTNFQLTIDPAVLPADRTLRNVVKPGSVILAPPLGNERNNRFHQIVSANSLPGGTSVFLTLSTGADLAAGGAVILLPDSVGLAERTYTPESGGDFAR
jgi:prepilin-type N-terminal cleavage/methylation domain-containing protein